MEKWSNIINWKDKMRTLGLEPKEKQKEVAVIQLNFIKTNSSARNQRGEEKSLIL